MKRIKSLGAVALAILGVAVMAAPAQAVLTRKQAAYQSITEKCLRYQGCHGITELDRVYSSNGACVSYYFRFYTSYAGTKYYWTGGYCSPPYAW